MMKHQSIKFENSLNFGPITPLHETESKGAIQKYLNSTYGATCKNTLEKKNLFTSHASQKREKLNTSKKDKRARSSIKDVRVDISIEEDSLNIKLPANRVRVDPMKTPQYQTTSSRR